MPSSRDPLRQGLLRGTPGEPPMLSPTAMLIAGSMRVGHDFIEAGEGLVRQVCIWEGGSWCDACGLSQAAWVRGMTSARLGRMLGMVSVIAGYVEEEAPSSPKTSRVGKISSKGVIGKQ